MDCSGILTASVMTRTASLAALTPPDGASAYRLDWNGLSFVWTGDGRPVELTLKYSKGVDVFVTEMQPDLGKRREARRSSPTRDDRQRPYRPRRGWLLIKPRLGMVVHLEDDRGTAGEMGAGVRTQWDKMGESKLKDKLRGTLRDINE